jgi:predicted nucleic acid-binding Zn ribbon protein
MMPVECINHPGKEALYKCTVCKKDYCAVCIELVDDRPYCFDCLKEIVKKTRSESKKGLTMNLMVAAMIAVVIALMSIALTPGLIELLFKIGSDLTAIRQMNVQQLQGLTYATLLVLMAVGILTTNYLSFYVGIGLNVFVLIAEVIGFSRGEVFGAAKGECFYTTLMKYPLSNCTPLFIFFVIGPLILLITLLDSRDELVGKKI